MLTLLGAQTTEDETGRRDRELEQLLLQVGRGDREAFARFWDKKDRAAVLALYGNVPLFWGLLALWYQLQKGRKDG